MVSVSRTALASFMTEILRSGGMDPESAAVAADCFAEADASGVSTHGAARLAAYHDALMRGQINARPDIRTERDAVFLRIDGDNGLGPAVAARMARAACDVAKETGMCLATVRHSNHFGIASYYADMATRQGMIAMVFSNASPTVAPFGGREARLGTNPVALAAPGGTREDGFTLDMATSVVSRGRIRQMGGDDATVPDDWAVTATGDPARTVAEVMSGALRPFGGARGSGIALFVDLMAGVLSNGSFGTDLGTMYSDGNRPSGTGHAMIVIDAERALGSGDWGERFDAFARGIRTSRPDLDHDAVSLPGDRRARTRNETARTGIPLRGAVWDSLRDLSDRTGIPLPEHRPDQMQGMTA
ncbi:lactate dehydrogenase [Primorskyibacter flagellatus]|uniref:Lactate dehydrogenase n=1 Tax=Primorskyibacter flagellatus TaxID=1387277 RepID=A0A917AE69_9RHOB|nr:Ldh family oxidoreductase [Primorskyibacter flagellatus]GGE46165.1 lactate dehydrogenase [Primorskyibacter flagellatus]